VLLRGDAVEPTPTKRVAVIGAALFVAGLALTVSTSERGKPLGMGLSMVGLVMSGPLLTGFVGRGLQLGATRVSPLGEMAAQRIARKPGRSARTAALLAATLAMTVILLIIGASGRVGFVRSVNDNVAEDVSAWVPSGFTLTDQQLADIRHLPGVTAATGGAQGQARVLDRGGRDEFLTVIDPATYFDVGRFAWTRSSSEGAARAAMLRTGNVLLATTISQRTHRHVGDTITLQTQHGPHAFRVAGTYAGLATGATHAVVVSTADATRWFGYHGITRLWIAAPERNAAVAATLEAAPWHLHSSIMAFQRANMISGFDGAWSMVAVTGVIATAIGLMGLVNTMVMEVVDRRHEIGVLRAVGAHRRDVQRVVSLEALGFGVMAGVVGLAAGTMVGRAAMTGLARDTEVAQVFRFSPVAVPLVTLLALVAGVLAGRLPARRAAAIDPAVVLRSL
jgi:putative ABC transport system permease protein